MATVGDVHDDGKLAELTATVLKDEWMRQTGTEPRGAFVMNRDLLGEVLLGWNDRQWDEWERFLRDSVECWLWRQSSKQQPGPFYVNSTLFSQRSLDVLADWRERRTRDCAGTWERSVTAEISATESRWLTMWWRGGAPPDMDVLGPSPRWVLASRSFRRTVEDGPWLDRPYTVDRRTAAVAAHMQLELTGVRRLSDRFLTLAKEAFGQARADWLSQLGLVSQVQLPEGVVKVRAKGFAEGVEEVRSPLDAWDRRLMTEVWRHRPAPPPPAPEDEGEVTGESEGGLLDGLRQSMGMSDEDFSMT